RLLGRDVVVPPEDVVGVVAALERDQAGQFRGAVHLLGSDAALVLGAAHEVDVGPARGDGCHVGGHATDEGGAGGVVGRVLPEAVDVEPEPGVASGERGRVAGDAGDGTAHVVDVHRGAVPGLLGATALEDGDHLLVEAVEGGVLPVGA